MRGHATPFCTILSLVRSRSSSPYSNAFLLCMIQHTKQSGMLHVLTYTYILCHLCSIHGFKGYNPFLHPIQIAVSVEFTESMMTVVEEERTLTVCLTKRGATTLDAEVTVTTCDRTGASVNIHGRTAVGFSTHCVHKSLY